MSASKKQKVESKTGEQCTALAIKLNNGALMPQLGFGTFLAAQGEAGESVRCALEAGYRHIDCAAVYANEHEIGEVFKKVFNDPASGIKREHVFITSKLAPANADPAKVKAALQQTLKDLQLDYLDLYLVHQPVPVKLNPNYDGKHRIIGKFLPLRSVGFGLQDVWRAMEDCQEAGLARAIGVSNYNAQTLNDLFMYAKVAPSVLQIERHPYHAQSEIVAFCQANGVAITNYAPLGAPGLYGAGQTDPLLSNSTVIEVGKRHGKTSAQVLIRWGIDTGTIVIPKSVKPHRIAENFNVLDFKLTQEDLTELAALDRRGRSFMQDWMGVPTFF